MGSGQLRIHFFYTQNAAVLDHELILTYKSYKDVEATN